MIGKVVLGLTALGVLMSLPVWRDMHHQESKGQSGWDFIRDQLILKERAKHIAVTEAVANARARYSLGIYPGY
ncbi:hypothetical protein ES703_73088 [subsurface metagenome]